MKQIILHVDMDAFYASVEVRDNPSLAGKPLIIGSLPHERGVVSTCSYEARKYGVRSAMNIKEAYRLCPQGIYMHPDFTKYRNVSAQLRKIWNAYASATETVALDEAYLDLTKTAKNFSAAREIAQTIKLRTKEELGLSCSVGVAYSKAAAKTASEEKKPDGYFEIPTKEDYIRLVIDREVRVLHGVGTKTAEKLNKMGIFTVRDLQQNSEAVVRCFGKHGRYISDLSQGIDQRAVLPYKAEDAKSISRELTFQKDTNSFELLKHTLLLLSIDVAARTRKLGVYARGVSLKLTYGNTKSITRSKAMNVIEHPFVLYQEAIKLLNQVEREPVRLIGIGVYHLSKGYQKQLTIYDYNRPSCVSPEEELRRELEKLGDLYRLDFVHKLPLILKGENLYKTVEYMRKIATRKKLHSL